jgi:hypothetical protein
VVFDTAGDDDDKSEVSAALQPTDYRVAATAFRMVYNAVAMSGEAVPFASLIRCDVPQVMSDDFLSSIAI